MSAVMKSEKKKVQTTKKVPPPGRKMGKQEARNYVFSTYRETLAMLASH